MMTLIGVDVYIWSAETPAVPKQHGKFTLALMSNRGTKIYPGPAPEMDLIDWTRCRYTSDQEVTNADVDALVSDLSQAGFTWTKTQKLFRAADGTDLFSQPY